MPSYTLTVTFKRDLSDDLEIARSQFPGKSDRDALVQQLRRELQEGYDQAGIAGHFNIDPDSYEEIGDDVPVGPEHDTGGV